MARTSPRGASCSAESASGRKPDATRVKNRNGKRVVVDGPFAETKEALGGYFLIECASKQEAIEWAARCPGADHGTIDVRPIWEM